MNHSGLQERTFSCSVGTPGSYALPIHGINQRDKDNLKIVSANLGYAYDETLKISFPVLSPQYVRQYGQGIMRYEHALYQLRQVHADRTKPTQAYTQGEPPTPGDFTRDEQERRQFLHLNGIHWRRNEIADPALVTYAWLLKHLEHRQWLNYLGARLAVRQSQARRRKINSTTRS